MFKNLSLAFCFCLLFAFTGKTQADLEITYAGESNYPLCPAPANSLTSLHIYNFGPFGLFVDSVEVYIDFGDGQDSTQWLMLTLPAGGVYVHSIAHVYLMPGAYPVTIVLNGPYSSDTATYTNYCSGICGNVEGYVYDDSNSNCVFDSGETPLCDYMVYLYDTLNNLLTSTKTDSLGYYQMNVDTGAPVNLKINPGYGLATSCPTAGTYTYTTGPGTATFDFGMICMPVFDLTVSVVSSVPVPGNNVYVNLFAQNYTCVTTNGSFTLTYDSIFTFIASTTPPSSTGPNSLTWNFTNLDLTTGGALAGIMETITFKTDTTAILGDTVDFIATIAPTLGDFDSTNNTFIKTVVVAAAYDPNVKDVVPPGIGPTHNVAPNTEFTYTVHFQNTGTAPAMNVNITDTLDNNLNLSTLDFIASSHAINLHVVNGNVLKATFAGINLPDSTSNEPESHGWFMYRIKSNTGLANGTVINNIAYIYFDYNAPIVTNTAFNTISIPLSIEQQLHPELNDIRVFPNPSGGYVNIQLTNVSGTHAVVTDIWGKVVLETELTGHITTINIDALPGGVYQVFIPGQVYKAARFIKLKP